MPSTRRRSTAREDFVIGDFQPLPTDLLGSAEAKADEGQTVLSVRDLSVRFPTDDGLVHAVENMSFDLHTDETLGIVGESGSGKSVTSMAVLGLLPKYAQMSGSILFRGEELIGRSDKMMQTVRGE